MPKHPHADNIAKFAQDAQETDRPWERWQWLTPGDEWLDFKYRSPAWQSDIDYRRKPQTVRIEADVPMPMQEEPESYQGYYVLCSARCDGVAWNPWRGDKNDHNAFRRGIWATREEAEQAAEAIFGQLGPGDDDISLQNNKE